MNLPNNFPLTEQQITTIDERLKGVSSYQGVGVAGPLRDLKRVFQALLWCLQRFETWRNTRIQTEAQRDALRAYMLQAEPIIAGYAAGNWDGGAAANQLIQDMPEHP